MNDRLVGPTSVGPKSSNPLVFWPDFSRAYPNHRATRSDTLALPRREQAGVHGRGGGGDAVTPLAEENNHIVAATFRLAPGTTESGTVPDPATSVITTD